MDTHTHIAGFLYYCLDMKYMAVTAVKGVSVTCRRDSSHLHSLGTELATSGSEELFQVVLFWCF